MTMFYDLDNTYIYKKLPCVRKCFMMIVILGVDKFTKNNLYLQFTTKIYLYKLLSIETVIKKVSAIYIRYRGNYQELKEL